MRALYYLLIAVSLTLCGTSVSARTVTPEFVKSMLAQSNTQEAVTTAVSLLESNNIKGLDTHLNGLSPMLREAALLDVTQRLLDTESGTQELNAFLRQLATQQPQFLLQTQQDGYWVTMPAFHYSSEARKVLNTWQYRSLMKQLDTLITYRQLTLSDWLVFSAKDYGLRRDALLAVLEKRSSADLTHLATQYLNDKTLIWSPDNAVLAKLASLTGNSELYGRLWRRGTDSYSLEALQNLRERENNSLAVAQMMAATGNPSLRDTAYRQLASLKPLPPDVQDFLAEKIAEKQQGMMIARLVAKEGHDQWLSSLLGNADRVSRRHVEQALANTAD